MKKLSLILALTATPALAAGDKFFSLANTDFVVLLAFLLFIAILFYFKVPSLLAGLLDKRADGISSELEEARALREEAQALLGSYERKQKEVLEQADRIVEAARKESASAAKQAKIDLESSIERRLAAAEDQIASAETGAIRDVRDQAAGIAVQAARQVIAEQLTKSSASKLIDDAIEEVGAKLH